mmetsp:Transcript_33776/g.77982  ORF Transcript_33776/g.77982 Transcript_33776/m.77982 type:complete len:158 (-) Transcript_33776:150-623(-)
MCRRCPAPGRPRPVRLAALAILRLSRPGAGFGFSAGPASLARPRPGPSLASPAVRIRDVRSFATLEREEVEEVEERRSPDAPPSPRLVKHRIPKVMYQIYKNYLVKLWSETSVESRSTVRKQRLRRSVNSMIELLQRELKDGDGGEDGEDVAAKLSL